MSCNSITSSPLNDFVKFKIPLVIFDSKNNQEFQYQKEKKTNKSASDEVEEEEGEGENEENEGILKEEFSTRMKSFKRLKNVENLMEIKIQDKEISQRSHSFDVVTDENHIYIISIGGFECNLSQTQDKIYKLKICSNKSTTKASNDINLKNNIKYAEWEENSIERTSRMGILQNFFRFFSLGEDPKEERGKEEVNEDDRLLEESSTIVWEEIHPLKKISPRFGHRTIVLEKNKRKDRLLDQILLFGGDDDLIDDSLYVIEPLSKSPSWKKIETSGKRAPCPRFGHAFVLLDENTALLAFGTSSQGFLNDFWLLNLQNFQWSEKNVVFNANRFSPRSGVGCVAKDGFVYFLGGLGSNNATTNEILRLDTTLWTLCRVPVSSYVPPFFSSYCFSFDNKIYSVFGGAGTNFLSFFLPNSLIVFDNIFFENKPACLSFSFKSLSQFKDTLIFTQN